LGVVEENEKWKIDPELSKTDGNQSKGHEYSNAYTLCARHHDMLSIVLRFCLSLSSVFCILVCNVGRKGNLARFVIEISRVGESMWFWQKVTHLAGFPLASGTRYRSFVIRRKRV
jgi:hypothetical protein